MKSAGFFHNPRVSLIFADENSSMILHVFQNRNRILWQIRKICYICKRIAANTAVKRVIYV